MPLIDFCIYCVIAIQDRDVPTRVIEGDFPISAVHALNAEKISNGEWTVSANFGSQSGRIPVIACCTGPGGIRLCSLHALEVSQDPRIQLPRKTSPYSAHPYPDRRYTGPGM